MTVDSNEKKPDSETDRRKKKRPRRRLVDLTLAPGTNKREGEKDRRRESTEQATEQREDSEK